MASFAATGHLTTLTSSRSKSKRSVITTRLPPTTTTPHKFLTPKCNASSVHSATSCQNPKPLKTKPFIPQAKTLVLSAASTSLLFGLSLLGNNNGNNIVHGGSGGGGGPNNFWSRFFSRPALAKEEEDPETEKGWTHHGLSPDIIVELSKLNGIIKYKVSVKTLFDRRRWANVGGEDSFAEIVSIKPGGVYPKSDLENELKTLAGRGMFERVELEAKPKPDGTLEIKVSFSESTWQAADRFACKSVGLLPPSKPVQIGDGMSEVEQNEVLKGLEIEYKRRMGRARPCILLSGVQDEILEMMKVQRKVSARLLQKIRYRVQKWYHDNGYLTAQVVNFGNLNTWEIVCEVAEGDITELVVQFLDKMGNECEGNTQLTVVTREIPNELLLWHPISIETLIFEGPTRICGYSFDIFEELKIMSQAPISINDS